MASSFGFDKCACLLLYHGASIDVPNAQGQSAKDEAKGQCVATFDLFLKKVSSLLRNMKKLPNNSIKYLGKTRTSDEIP